MVVFQFAWLEMALNNLPEVPRSRVLVTGANGFVGRVLCATLLERGFDLVSVVRRASSCEATSRCQVVGEIDGMTDWIPALQGVEVIVHLAARVHVMDETDGAAEAEFERINVQGVKHLARQAAEAGVRRLVFVSSIKVNGEATHGVPFCEEDVPRPEDAYGRSKLAAEQALTQVSFETGLEVVVVRPPMVIGPDAKGNLSVLIGWLFRGLPLPLACVRNRRSFIGVRNLAELLVCCVSVPAAAGQVFLAADEPSLSTPELIAGLAHGLGRKARLWSLPLPALRWLAILAGKRAQIDRLSGDLEIDASKARRVLAWVNRESLDDALHSTARQYLQASGAQK